MEHLWGNMEHRMGGGLKFTPHGLYLYSTT